MENLNLKQQKHEILRGPVSPRDAASIISCCKFAWPEGIYPYKALMDLQSWMPGGELGVAIEKGSMYSSVVRDESGQIVAHAALVKNKLGLWELGRVSTSDPGKGYGTRAVEGVLEQADRVGAELVYMGRSYNRTPMELSAMKAAKANEMEMNTVGVSPHLYDEQGSSGKGYGWGEVDYLIIKKSKRLLIPQSKNMPSQVKRLIKILANNNPSIDVIESYQHNDKVQERIKIDEHIGLIDVNDISQQEDMIKAGCIPVGILPIKGGLFVKFFKGEMPQVKLERMSIIKPGISPIYCSDEREFQIINSILNK